MHHIRIENIRESGSGSLGDVYIDGIEIKGVVSIRVSASIDDITRVTLVLFPESLEIKGDMEVEVVKSG